jgi:hypothetical protein
MIGSKLFSTKQIVIIGLATLAGVVVLQRSLRYVCENCVSFDCPYYWPISIFSPRLPAIADIAVSVGVLAAFAAAALLLDKLRYRLLPVILASIVLIVGLSFVHGAEVGFCTPIAGDLRFEEKNYCSNVGQEYYHEAVKITDGWAFLSNYNSLQPGLSLHSHTHPPGAVLTFYAIYSVVKSPYLISISIAVIALFLTGFFYYKLLSLHVSEEIRGYGVFLLAILPAVQIYYLATLDALVASLLLGGFYFFSRDDRIGSAAIAAAFVWAGLMLTFVSTFILPVIVLYELYFQRSLKRSTLLVALVTGLFGLLYLVSGFDVVASFRLASHFENPHGFMLLVDPVNYLFTRVEDIAEILLFFGPFLTYLLIKSVRRGRGSPQVVISLIACTVMMMVFATGAFRTGETARACMFMYPFLLLPVIRYLDDVKVDRAARWQLATLVFGQSIAMQLFGNYFW